MAKFKTRSLAKAAARHPARIRPRRGEKPPPGYTVKYEESDSDYATHRRKMFVKKVPKHRRLSEPYHGVKRRKKR